MKKIVLILAAALACAGLIIGCGGDNKPPPGPPVPPDAVMYRVTFNPDGGTFADGTTVNKVIEIEENKAVTVTRWPDVERGTDELIGWYDGETEYTFSKLITKDVTLMAKWEGAEMTIDAAAGTAVHENFVFEVSPGGTHSNFDGEDNGDNSFTYSVGAIRYRFPITVGFDYKDYDFVDIEYTAEQAAGMVCKHYATGNDYAPFFPSSDPRIVNGTDNIVTFELRNATGGGVAIQKWNGAVPDITITITNITFRKGTRYTIKFDTDGGSALADSYLVEGTKVSNHLPTNTTKAGSFFAGWLYANGTPVNGADLVDSTFDDIELKALWLASIPGLEPIEVEFAAAGDIIGYGGAQAVVAPLADGSGYSFAGGNYEWTYAYFNIDIPAGATLAHYDYVSFKFEGKTGDYVWKDTFCLMAGAALGTTGGPTITEGLRVSEKGLNDAGNPADMKLAIIKPLASGLTGTIKVGIFVGTTTVSYEISDIVFGIDD
jgi:hypothetical protein